MEKPNVFLSATHVGSRLTETISEAGTRHTVFFQASSVVTREGSALSSARSRSAKFLNSSDAGRPTADPQPLLS